jgi:hypothetical protein
MFGAFWANRHRLPPAMLSIQTPITAAADSPAFFSSCASHSSSRVFSSINRTLDSQHLGVDGCSPLCLPQWRTAPICVSRISPTCSPFARLITGRTVMPTTPSPLNKYSRAYACAERSRRSGRSRIRKRRRVTWRTRSMPSNFRISVRQHATSRRYRPDCDPQSRPFAIKVRP